MGEEDLAIEVEGGIWGGGKVIIIVCQYQSACYISFHSKLHCLNQSLQP